MAFIDIHSHVLHGLDDGARSLDESRAMLDMAAADGVTDIVATPHANSRYRFDAELVDARIVELQGHAPVRLHRGCDFRLQPDTLEDALAHPAKYAINQKSYLLVEFPDLTIFSSSEHVLMRLLDTGLTPIISHPERHQVLARRPADLARWVGMGCCVQITAGSITGHFGSTPKALAHDLVGRGLVHFVASDAHDTERRPPTLSPAYRALAEEWGEDSVRPFFVNNPAAVVTGEPFDSIVRPLRSRSRRWYQFWG